ncbi:MAG: pyridoxal-phosphate dependent enzyme [Firmicutes bacterium]|nr:pyridoxal-phosphate dependent enzyme [Bacillota bacterium]
MTTARRLSDIELTSGADFPTLRDVLLARRRIAPYLRETPLVAPWALAQAAGAEVYLKLENLQPIGAFKVRGGVNLVAAERSALEGRGLMTASTGNHGQSIAYAGHLFGLPVSVYAPRGANPLKVRAMEALGAEVVLVGDDFDAAREACERDARAQGARYVHSMNEPLLIAGVATLYLEALEAVPDVDAVLVPVGGGSGLSAAGLVAKTLNPGIRVVGVQAAGAPAFAEAYRTGTLASTARAATQAEGLATRQAFALPVAMARRYVDDVVLVSDDEMAEAMRVLLETAHIVAEMAGAAGLAALLRYGPSPFGRRVLLPITGGNATRAQLAALFSV